MNSQKASGNESRICCRQNIQRKGNEDARQNVITTALNGMLWIARGGAPWRELPERYGPWQTVYSRFRKWKKLGVLEAIFQALTIDVMRIFRTFPLTLHPARYIKALMVGKKARIKRLGCPEAAEIRRFIPWWMA